MRLSTGQWILVREQRTREGGWVITHSDITDTIERTHQLEQKTSFLQMTLDTVNAGIRVVDKDWNLIAWNQQYVRLFDYPERLMHAGMPLVELLRASAKEGLLGDGNPDELAEQEVEKARQRARGIPTQYIYNDRRFDVVRLALPDGSDFCAFSDVTEAFERQRQLQEKSTLLQTVFDTINEGIWVCDKDWRLLYWNHRYARMRSYPKDLMRVAVPLIDLFRYSARRSTATAAEADRIAESRLREIASRRSGQTYRYEATDGQMLETRIFTMPNGDHLATVTDITETINHQRQLAGKTSLLQTTLDSISQGLRVFDHDWRLVVYNRHYADLTGFSPELMQVGARLIDLLRDAANRGLLGAGDPEALAQGQFDFIRNAPSGKPIQVRLTGGVVLEILSVQMPDGTNFGTVTDITERLRAEADRERLEGQLRHKLKMEAIGTLAGGIAHDFNNILSAIIGYSEMALNCLPKGARPERHVREILAAGTRAKALTAQILEFSRQREGERKPVRLSPILADTLQLIRASVPSTVELQRVMLDPSLAVLADSTQIHQVIMNLCTNAWQAMPQGGVLELGLDRIDSETDLVLARSILPPGRYARIWVTDNGHGIEPAATDRIFDPFFTTKSVNGTGLGLSVVYGIVTRHGGGIDVQSMPDHGTRFDVYLPVCDEPLEDGDALQPVPRGRGQVILLVDDEESLVALGEELLAELGYEPAGYDSGAAALQAFRDNPQRFDLVMLDQMMPRMTGTEIAEQISRIRADVPVVLMTGYDDPALDGQVAAGKIRRLLLKPLSIHEIGSCLAQILDSA